MNGNNVMQIYLKVLPAQFFLYALQCLRCTVNGAIVGSAMDAASLAAIALFAPLTCIFAAVYGIISSGSTIMCGHKLGRGDIKGVHEVFTDSVWMAIGSSAVIGILMVVCARQMSLILESGEQILSQIMDYVRGQAPGMIPFVLIPVLAAYVQLNSRSGQISIYTLLQAVANLAFVLAAVYMFDGGLFAVSVASSLSSYVPLLYLAIYIYRSRIAANVMRSFNRIHIAGMLSPGIPAAALSLFTGVRDVVINNSPKAFIKHRDELLHKIKNIERKVMIYRNDRYGNRISQLGFGCMRFRRKGGTIDFAAAEKQVIQAIELGVNYFDTAYMYPGSEECLGKILASNHCREKVCIATKLPQYMIRSLKAVEKTFKTQMERLQTDYIDYYLMHMFTDLEEWKKLQDMGIEKWISDAKAAGRIRQIGFSFHGDSSMFLKILDAYDWDFCMIQYNYLDEHSQAGRKGLQAAAAKGIPVMIMEPLRGGKLVNLPKDAEVLLRSGSREYSPAELGLRWLWNQPEVTCVISGMNSEEMINENVRIASEAEAGHLHKNDMDTIESVKSIIRQKEKVGCTGCGYCMPCPEGVDIPGYFHCYNMTSIDSKSSARFEFARNIGMRKEPAFASQCVGCRACEKHCPQTIEISRVIHEADRALRPLPYKLGISIARKII